MVQVASPDADDDIGNDLRAKGQQLISAASIARRRAVRRFESLLIRHQNRRAARLDNIRKTLARLIVRIGRTTRFHA